MNIDANNDKTNSIKTHTITDNPSSNIQDYEVEITEKKGVFSKLFEKLKQNKNQKLLDSGNNAKTTNRSISSLWEIGNIRTSLFSSFDNVRKAFTSKFSKTQEKRNTLAIEIIGEEKEINQDEKVTLNSSEKEVILPPVIQDSKPKNIINNVPKIEVSRIDTSAITEKDAEEKENHLDDSFENKKTTNTISADKSIDER